MLPARFGSAGPVAALVPGVPGTVTGLLRARVIDHFGVKRRSGSCLKIHTPGTPAAQTLTEAARRHHLSVTRLTVKT